MNPPQARHEQNPTAHSAPSASTTIWVDTAPEPSATAAASSGGAAAAEENEMEILRRSAADLQNRDEVMCLDCTVVRRIIGSDIGVDKYLAVKFM